MSVIRNIAVFGSGVWSRNVLARRPIAVLSVRRGNVSTRLRAREVSIVWRWHHDRCGRSDQLQPMSRRRFDRRRSRRDALGCSCTL